MDKKGEYREILSRFFSSHAAETFVVELFSVSLISAIEKLYAF